MYQLFNLNSISEHFPLTSWFTVTDRLLLGTCDPYFTYNEIVVLKMSKISYHDPFGFLNYMPSVNSFYLPAFLIGLLVIKYIHIFHIFTYFNERGKMLKLSISKNVSEANFNMFVCIRSDLDQKILRFSF